MENAVHLEGLSFSWPKTKTPVLEINELCIPRGEGVFVEGPSGSGKSTLLSIIGGVLDAKGHRAEVLDFDFLRMKASQKDQVRANDIGFIFQVFNLLPYLSVVDNVLLPVWQSRKKEERCLKNASSSDSEAKRLLEEMGIGAELFERKASQLSIGQQQRVAAARALIGAPDLIIADEPSSALDEEHKNSFVSLLLKESKRYSSTLVYVSHDPRSSKHFDRSIKLNEINKAFS